MSFNIGLSGLRGAQTELSVTGNNLANASTVGFKQSRAEFGDMYASLMGGGMDRPGMGVRTQQISQQHTQGGFDFTERSLDMAIDGEGYFILDNRGETEYTRAGYFDLDKDGFVINNEGKRLQGFPSGAGDQMTDLQVSVGLIPQKVTDQARVEINLDSREVIPVDNEGNPLEFAADDPATYNFSRALDIYDSLGEKHQLKQYFTLTQQLDGTNTWDVNFTLNDEAAGNTNTTLTFGPDGRLTQVGDVATVDDDGNPLPALFDLEDLNVIEELDINGQFENIEINFSGMTQYGASSSVLSLSQNGYASGSLAGLSVNEEGWITGRYTNGQNIEIGRLGLATFVNPQGLKQIGGNSWVETQDSGLAAVNPAGEGRSGLVQGGALEQSTVDVSEELVKMIIAQRNYQANAKTIQTQDTLNQTIINLR